MSKRSKSERFMQLKVAKAHLNGYVPTIAQVSGLDEYFKLYGYRKSQDRYPRLANFARQGVTDFISKEAELLQYDRMSIEYFMCLYGPEEGRRRWDNGNELRRISLPSTTDFWINRGYTKERAIEQVRSRQKHVSKISAETRDHRLYSQRCPEYWESKGYSRSGAIECVSNVQRRDLRHFSEKYGHTGGMEKYRSMCNTRKESWGAKSSINRKVHGLRTAPTQSNQSGLEMQAVRMFILQNNIDETRCRFGAPRDQFYQWIDDHGFRRYDLAVYEDAARTKLTAIMEFHGPGHINFSDYTPDLENKIIEIGGRKIQKYGTYGRVYNNDKIKREHILKHYPECKYYVFWMKDLKAKDFRVYDL